MVTFDIVLEDCDTSCLSCSRDCSAAFSELEGKLRGGGLVFVHDLLSVERRDFSFTPTAAQCLSGISKCQIPALVRGDSVSTGLSSALSLQELRSPQTRTNLKLF